MQQNKQTIVELQGVGLQLNQRVILDEVDLKVQSGEIVTIIGPNGAGKSSLIKIVLGLLQPTKGKVNLTTGIRIGYMPQKLKIESLMPLTVKRFLMLAPLAYKQNFEAIVAEIGIADHLNLPLQAISGGEMQRVLLARAILNQPDLLVLDEPAQGIDVTGQAKLYQLIVNMRAKLGCAVLMVSHDLHLVIAGTDRVVCLNQHVCCSGHPATITKHPEFIQLFGENVAEGLAIYTHHHDHQHD